METEKNKMKIKLEAIAKQMRKDVFKIALNSGTKGAHIGGSMSMMEILAVLYGQVMNYDPKDGNNKMRDRFILSKAHGAIGLYSALKYAGFISEEELNGALQGESFLYKHPVFDPKHGMEFAGGSLGHGLALGVGTAIALKSQGNEAKVYVVLGDGECDEGSVWEAASSIIHYKLKNVITIVDQNGLQNDGKTEDVMYLGNLQRRFESLGFDIILVDGHDVLQLEEALTRACENPKVIIAKTIKGKGVSFAENVVDWHIAYFTEEMYKQVMEEYK